MAAARNAGVRSPAHRFADLRGDRTAAPTRVQPAGLIEDSPGRLPVILAPDLPAARPGMTTARAGLTTAAPGRSGHGPASGRTVRARTSPPRVRRVRAVWSAMPSSRAPGHSTGARRGRKAIMVANPGVVPTVAMGKTKAAATAVGVTKVATAGAEAARTVTVVAAVSRIWPVRTTASFPNVSSAVPAMDLRAMITCPGAAVRVRRRAVLVRSVRPGIGLATRVRTVLSDDLGSLRSGMTPIGVARFGPSGRKVATAVPSVGRPVRTLPNGRRVRHRMKTSRWMRNPVAPISISRSW